jgi:hypothetical protein
MTETLITQCYQGFISKGKINPTYVSREECRAALLHGKHYHVQETLINF